MYNKSCCLVIVDRDFRSGSSLSALIPFGLELARWFGWCSLLHNGGDKQSGAGKKVVVGEAQIMQRDGIKFAPLNSVVKGCA